MYHYEAKRVATHVDRRLIGPSAADSGAKRPSGSTQPDYISSNALRASHTLLRRLSRGEHNLQEYK